MEETIHCNHRDLHPGDYVFANLYIKEDNTSPIQTIIRADIITPSYLGAIEGSGVTKYAWSEIYPIPLTADNLAKFDLNLISSIADQCRIFARGLVTIDAEYHMQDGTVVEPRVFFNDGDGQEASYMHEVQQYVYKASGGTYDFDILPEIHPFKDLSTQSL